MQQIHFFEAGNGFPVVFLHGFCESNTIWDALGVSLSDEIRVLCPDLPGFGKSPLPNKSFSLEEIGDVLVSWLQGIGVHKCIVIGHSLGGYIALELLRKHQNFVAGIGLFNSSAFEDANDKKENRNKLIAFIKKHGVKPFLATFVPSLFYPPTAERYQKTIDKISEEGIDIQPESVMKYAAAMRDRQDSIDLLEKYPDRILLISGEFDQNVPIEKSKEMAKILDSANTHIMKDSAHMSLFEQSDACYDAIRAFVRSIS